MEQVSSEDTGNTGVQDTATESVGNQEIKLDLGCGKNKQVGFLGVDSRPFDGVDIVQDLRVTPWKGVNGEPLPDNSVSEVHSSHFVEHLTGAERVDFFNELFRILKPGAQARIITPSWSNERAYGDPTHQWPPVCSWTYFYTQKSWREINAPHTDYTCDFDYVLMGTYDINDSFVAFRNNETKSILMSKNINTTTDLIATLTKRTQ